MASHTVPSANPAAGTCKPFMEQTPARYSLDDLPDSLLWDIAHRTGPRARLLCRSLRALHPAPSALHLHTRPLPPTAIQHLLTHPCTPAPSITALTLPPTSPTPPNPSPTPNPLPKPKPLPPPAPPLATVAAALPTLQSLTYTAPAPPSQAEALALAPLAPHLTSLHIHPPPTPTPPPRPHDPTPLDPLSALPALRSLTLPLALPHPTRLAPFLAPLSTLPHLHHLTLHLPPTAYIPPTLLPALASAAPRLTALRLLNAPLAWDPPSISALHHSLPHLTHFHLHLGITPSPALWYIPTRPPPPGAPHPAPPSGPWQALGTALRHRTDSGLTLTAELNLSSPSWAPLLPHLSPTDLTLRFTPHDLHHHPALATALWSWLPSQRTLTRLTIHSPLPPTSPHPLPLPPIPLHAALANAYALTSLSLTLDWLPPEACHALPRALRPLTRLTHLHLSGPPAAPWPLHATEPLTALVALQHLSLANGGLPRSALPHLPHLPSLHTLSIAHTPDPAPAPSTAHPAPPPGLAANAPPQHPSPPPVLPPCFTDDDLALLPPLRSRLTSLTLKGFAAVTPGGLASLHALTSLERLHLVNMPCVEADARGLQGGMLPLPPALRYLEVAGPAVLTLEGREGLRAVGWQRGCRVRVDGAVVGGVQWPLDTGVAVPEVERQYEEQYMQCRQEQRGAAGLGLTEANGKSGQGLVLEQQQHGAAEQGVGMSKCADVMPGAALEGVAEAAAA